MAKDGTSESQAQSQAGDPWSSWTATTQTHENNAVPESPTSLSFQAPQTEEEDAKKSQTDNEDTGARSSKEVSATGTKTDKKGQTDNKDGSSTETEKEDDKNVSDRKDVTDENIHKKTLWPEGPRDRSQSPLGCETPSPEKRASQWPTPHSGTWRSTTLQDWYNDGRTSLGGRTAQGGWWGQNQSAYNRWHWTLSQPSWSAWPWWSTAAVQPDKEKVVIKMVDTGVVTDTTPTTTKVSEATTGMQTDPSISPAAAAAAMPAAPTPVAPTSPTTSLTSDRNRDYSAPPEFKGLNNLEHYRKSVGRWKDRTGFKPEEQAGKIIDTLPMDIATKINKLPEAELSCASGVSRVLGHLAVLNGERPGDDQKKANREAMYKVGIERGETLTDYVLRRETQFDEAEKRGTVFPDQTKAQMLEEGANLTWQRLATTTTTLD